MKKKLAALILALMMAVTLCGCAEIEAAFSANGGDAEPVQAAEPSESPEVQESTAPEEESAEPTETPEATGEPQAEPEESPEAEASVLLPEEKMDLHFCSGVGAWGTELTLNADGTFTGEYHDSDADWTDEYPNGTVYTAVFRGAFTDIAKNDDGSYSMKLDRIETERPKDETWIEDGFRYISSDPYGVETGTWFVLYLPGTKIEGLDEEFLSWWQGRFDTPAPDALKGYGLWNKDAGYGFFN